jgi:hypothetical protein
MVTVKIHGGFGNQMFQYAAARALALRNGTELRLDTSPLCDWTPWKNFTFRNYAISTVFDIDPPLNLAAKFESHVRIPYFAKAFNKYYPRALAKLGYWQFVEDKNAYVFDPAVFNLRGNVYLDGHWQTERYFKDYKDAIHSDFTFRPRLEGATAALAERTKSTPNAVSLFIRRKETLTNPILKKMYYVATPEFYAQAIAIMKKKIGKKAVFFISSDEIDWCRENFKIDAEHIFVGDEHNGPECANALHLMSLCKHFIMPNSSFSWWAAWLSENSDKVVIAPKRWSTDITLDMRDILPPSWIGL